MNIVRFIYFHFGFENGQKRQPLGEYRLGTEMKRKKDYMNQMDIYENKNQLIILTHIKINVKNKRIHK